MLTKIWIKNFALIQELRVDFSTGYTVITGETGSGKSILLGAINLILGERADYNLIGPDGTKTFVEAEFLISNPALQKWFDKNDIDFDPHTIVRREINSSGRSRAFINDIPVSLPQIKQLTENLININSQHNTLALRDKAFHLEILDVLADLEPKTTVFNEEFKVLKREQRKLAELMDQIQQADRDRDYIAFQLEELEELNLENFSYKDLEEELGRQENMDALTATLSDIDTCLTTEQSVIDQLKVLAAQLTRNRVKDEKIEALTARISSSILELEDVALEASRYLEGLERNPDKILELTTKVDRYNRVLQKHKCTSQEELMDLQSNWREQLTNSDAGKIEIENLQVFVRKKEEKIEELANALHLARAKSADAIAKKIVTLLDELKMPNTALKFEISKSETLNNKGFSAVSLLFSSNTGMPLQAMDKIASGGELSRLMLSIQCLISEMKALPSLIFDEIDTGVSGEVAQKIGQLLRRMGENRQLIAISHLPQVAGKATSHIKVEKTEISGRTQSSLRTLTRDERVSEIARLMSGETINAAALENAQNLMQE